MKVLVVTNMTNSRAVDAQMVLATYLASQGIDFDSLDSCALPEGPCLLAQEAVVDPEAYEVAFVLGGDGAILRTARLLAGSRTPIMGMNFGNLGFLANDSETGVVALAAAAFAGDVVLEERANLYAEVYCEPEEGKTIADYKAFEGGSAAKVGDFLAGAFFCLNEAAVCRGTSGRVVSFNLAIGGQPIASMRGDGVIVSTATGSTAYSLSAGGPFVEPSSRALIVAPLAVHTLKERSIVTGSSDVVEIDLHYRGGLSASQLFVDGDLVSLPAGISRVVVRRGDVPTVLMRYQPLGYYEQISQVFFQ